MRSKRNRGPIGRIAESMVKDRDNGFCVFVTGAGASAPAGLPTSKVLKRSIRVGFEEEITSRLNEYLKRRGEPQVRNLDNVALEVILPIYAEVVRGADTLVDFVDGSFGKDATKDKFPPLGYEVLAHFMAQGLVRHVVSLNFDELLDVALDEEVGANGYEQVRNKSRFTQFLDEVIEKGRLKRTPALLKPHGTISLVETLRVKPEQVFDLEEQKAKVLETVFKGKALVFVGYSFMDPDIRKLVWRMVKAGQITGVYFVGRTRRFLRNNRAVAELLGYLRANDRPADFIAGGTESFFTRLGKTVAQTDDGRYLPNITRHLIRNVLFRDAHFPPTTENRLLAEILIFALKVKGKFKTKALLTCRRIQRYATELVPRDETPSRCIWPALEKLESNNVLLIEKERNGVPVGIGDEVCHLLASDPVKAAHSPRDLKALRRRERAVVKSVVEGIVAAVPNLFGPGRFGAPQRQRLAKLMTRLVEDFDYDLAPLGLHPFEFSFCEPEHKGESIEHRKQLEALKILRKTCSEDQECYIFGETGEWVVRLKERADRRLLRTQKVRIGISDVGGDPSKSLHKARAERVFVQLRRMCRKDSIRVLDWDTNRHHGTFSVNKCIYFCKDGKPSTLQPLVLSDPKDTERLMTLGKYLWEKLGRPVP